VNAKANILVVDDEQAHTLLISELLKKSDYAVSTANDGFKALAACRVHPPDLIILDLYLPLMGGMNILARLQSEDKLRQIPIVLLGVKDKPFPEIPTVGIAKEDVINKPFEPNELLARIKAVLNQRTLSEKLELKERQLSELALEDPLTSLKTARYLREFVRTNVRQARRYGVPFSIVTFRLDNFAALLKSSNSASCAQLVADVSKFVAGLLRDSDVVARTNESEITMALTVTDRKGAIEVAERLRNAIRQVEFTLGQKPTTVTISLGLCEYSKSMNDDGDLVLSHARAAMNQAYDNGGDVTLMAE
jgi:diguanylate cyclase (GGDEF)-like protein